MSRTDMSRSDRTNSLLDRIYSIPLNKPSRKTVLFLCAAFIIVMFIAAILACITMFIYADRYSTEARLLDRAVTETTSIAETLKAADGDLAAAGQLMGEHQIYDAAENTLTFYYDDELRPASQQNSPYRAVIEKSEQNFCYQYDIRIFGSQDGSDDIDVYQLTFRTVKDGGGR